jgi:hypothetical protein
MVVIASQRREKTMFQPAPPPSTGNADVDRIRGSLRHVVSRMQRVGSRVTCSPPPVDTDEDWLLLVRGDPAPSLHTLGFTQDGSPEFYTGSDAGGFRSWRKGDLNLVTTPDPHFFDLFVTATALAKRFNLLVKADRIALFQAVLYGVRVDCLAHPGDRLGPNPAERIELVA